MIDWLLILLGAYGAALILLVIRAERRNMQRTTCRNCGTPIRKGGYGLAPLGCGFCRKCRNRLL